MSNLDQQPPFAVSKNTAAKLFEVSLDTIERMVARGDLEKIQVSTRKVAITWRSLQKLLPSEAAWLHAVCKCDEGRPGVSW
jgi:hypothetical protein